MKVSGFSSLSAAALLLLVAALVSLAVAGAGDSLQAETRTKRTLDRQAAVWKVTTEALEAFEGRWQPDRQEWVDFARDQRFSLPVEFDDLSSRINLNSLNTFVLSDSLLVSTLSGGNVVAFQDLRLRQGPFVALTGYQEVFTKESLAQLYTTWSVFDVNTVDEQVAERVAALRTDDPGVGASLRQVLQTAREAGVVFTPELWRTQSARLSSALDGLFDVEPELNVNTAPEFLLEAFLTYPAFSLAQPAAKLRALVAGRLDRPWTEETLAATLGVEKSARILQYLGTRSWFLQGTITDQNQKYQFVVQRREAKAEKPSFRLVSQGWTL